MKGEMQNLLERKRKREIGSPHLFKYNEDMFPELDQIYLLRKELKTWKVWTCKALRNIKLDEDTAHYLKVWTAQATR